jgi:hypothetical protein
MTSVIIWFRFLRFSAKKTVSGRLLKLLQLEKNFKTIFFIFDWKKHNLHKNFYPCSVMQFHLAEKFLAPLIMTLHMTVLCVISLNFIFFTRSKKSRKKKSTLYKTYKHKHKHKHKDNHNHNCSFCNKCSWLY